MKSEQLATALAAVAGRLVALASDDPQLRMQLRLLAEAVLDATQPAEKEGQAAETPGLAVAKLREALGMAGNGEPAVEPEPAAPAVEPPAPPAVLPELTLGRSAPPEEPPAPSYPEVRVAPAEDFLHCEARCRLKAAGARWAARRRRLIADGATFSIDIEPMDREIIAKAKAMPDCFLWMCHPSGPSPSDLRQYDDVGECFDVAADAIAVLKQIQDEPDLHQSEFGKALDLLAEAQSALRMAITQIDGPVDSDQMKVFAWLKETASANQIFIQRFMRLDDPADPAQSADLAARIEAVDSAMQETRRRAKQRRKLLGKVRHKVSLIADDPGGADEHWKILASTVAELVDDGVPPSNRELRELLLPAIDTLPEDADLPKGLQLVLREIDRFLATCPPPEAPEVAQPTTPEVKQVARLLGGRSMVLIGGERRPGSYQALKSAFGLRELIWIETREHQSIDGFEAYVARPDVAAVLLAIRWTSHSFGDVREFCDRHGKPLVRLPGGYNPNQVAAQVMAQCSERLKVEITA